MKYRIKAFENIFGQKLLYSRGGDIPSADRNPDTHLESTENTVLKQLDPKQVIDSTTQTADENIKSTSPDLKQDAIDLGYKQVSEVRDLLKKLSEEQKEVVEGTIQELGNFMTGENITELRGTFGNIIEKGESLKDINLGSLKQMVNNPNFSIDNIFSQIQPIVAKMNGKISIFDHFGKVADMKKIYEKSGYKPDGIFGYSEASSLFRVVQDIKYTQDKFRNGISDNQKLAIITDFNLNGLSENKLTFNGNEVQFANLKPGEFTNILNNLGIEANSFENQLKNNYFSGREDFKTALARFAEMDGTSLSQLILPKEDFDKTMDFLVNKNVREAKNIQSESTEIKASVTKMVDNTISKIQSEAKAKGKEFNVSNEVKNQFIGAVVGAVQGASYSTDTLGKKVSEMTGGLLSNISIGGSPEAGIGLVIGGSKNFGDRVTANFGLANGVPYIGANGKLIETKDNSKNLFNETMKSGVDANAGITITPIGPAINASISRVSEQTSSGIKQMVKNASQILDNALGKIADGVPFEKSGMEQNAENKKTYETLKNQYNSFGKQAGDNFKKGIMRAYQNELYKNAEGIKFSGVSLASIGPIIIGGITLEKINSKYEKKSDIEEMNNFIKDLNDAKNAEIQLQNQKVMEENARRKQEATQTKIEDVNSKLKGFDEKALETINKLSPQISDLIDVKSISKLGQLETSIHNLLNGKGNLEKTWGEFLDKMKVLKKNVSFLSGEYSKDEKLLILQSVGINLMKKEGLKVNKNGEISIKKGGESISIKSYDKGKGRDKYFDEIFEKEFKFLSPSIKKARQKFYEDFGTKENYKISQVPVDGGVGFTGVEIGTGEDKKNSVNPYVASNIATFDGFPGKVKIESDIKGLSQVVDRLPKHIIEPLIKQLEAHGYKFPDGDKVGEMKRIILNGKAGSGKDEFTVKNEVYFTKAAECLNDMVLMDFSISYKKEIPGTGTYEDVPLKDYVETKLLDTGKGKNSSINVNIGVSYKKEEKPKEPPKNPPKEPPKNPPKEPPKNPPKTDTPPPKIDTPKPPTTDTPKPPTTITDIPDKPLTPTPTPTPTPDTGVSTRTGDILTQTDNINTTEVNYVDSNKGSTSETEASKD